MKNEKQYWPPLLCEGASPFRVHMSVVSMTDGFFPRTLQDVSKKAGISRSTLYRARTGIRCTKRTANALNGIDRMAP